MAAIGGKVTAVGRSWVHKPRVETRGYSHLTPSESFALGYILEAASYEDAEGFGPGGWYS